MQTMTIDDLIQVRGGASAIAEASQATLKPVKPNTVHKWRKNGIPDDHWELFLGGDVTEAVIYAANMQIRRRDHLRMGASCCAEVA